MIDSQKVQKALDDFDAAVRPSGANSPRPLGVNFDACGTWKGIRGTIPAIIDGLNAVATIVPIAKKAADVIQTMKNLLDVLCP